MFSNLMNISSLKYEEPQWNHARPWKWLVFWTFLFLLAWKVRPVNYVDFVSCIEFFLGSSWVLYHINSITSYETERTRQEKLARERIMARQQQRKGSTAKSSEEKLQNAEEQDKKEDVVTIAQLQKEGIVALQDSVLNEMEKKHQNEQEVSILNWY